MFLFNIIVFCLTLHINKYESYGKARLQAMQLRHFRTASPSNEDGHAWMNLNVRDSI